MNERIRELAEQAMVTNNRGDGYYNRILDPKKFAELIVKECLDIIDEEGSHEGGSIRSMNMIKQHFGVEE